MVLIIETHMQVEWTAYEHPQLGRVEVGGLMETMHMNPMMATMGPIMAGCHASIMYATSDTAMQASLLLLALTLLMLMLLLPVLVVGALKPPREAPPLRRSGESGCGELRWWRLPCPCHYRQPRGSTHTRTCTTVPFSLPCNAS